MTIQTTQRASHRQMYGLAFLGLLSLTVTLFTIIWPMNGAPSDDWIYPFYGKERLLTVIGSNRQFGLAQVVLNEILFPGRFELLYVWQILNIALTGWIIFYLVRRLLSGKGWFALVAACIFVLYIPNNPDQARALYSGNVYTLVTLIGITAVTLLTESLFYSGKTSWVLAGMAGVVGYFAIRAYESWIPVLFLAPLLWGLLRTRLSAKSIWLLFLWYIGIGIGTLQFLVPYLQNDTSVRYQQLFNQGDKVSIPDMLRELMNFYRQSFAVRSALNVDGNFLGFAVGITLLALVFLIVFWRRYPHEHDFPNMRQLFSLIGMGLIGIGLSGLVFAYAGMDLRYTFRANFYASPMQALVIASVFLSLAIAIKKFFRLPAQVGLLGMMGIMAFFGAYWYGMAQAHAEDFNQRFRTFDESVAFFDDLKALLPHLEPHTLVILYCFDDSSTAYQWANIDAMSAPYNYDGSVYIGVPAFVTFTEQGIDYAHPSPSLALRESFRYDELVAVDCEPGYPYLLDKLPPEITTHQSVRYNPYLRLVAK